MIQSNFLRESLYKFFGFEYKENVKKKKRKIYITRGISFLNFLDINRIWGYLDLIHYPPQGKQSHSLNFFFL